MEGVGQAAVTAPLTIVGVILARMGSRRLPGKAMLEIEGKPLIGYVFDRCRLISGLRDLVLATTEDVCDDALDRYARKMGVLVTRGPSADVTLRVLRCVRETGCDAFVRFNGDSPFVDPALVEEGLAHYRKRQPDLVTNVLKRTFPYGISVEVVRTSTFERIYPKLRDRADLEHVTRYFYRHPDDFEIVALQAPDAKLARVRLVVDTGADLRVIGHLIRRLGPRCSTASYREVAQTALEIRQRRRSG